jgi:peptide deformylase
MEEGCLSVRPLFGKVRRATRATIEAYNEHGEKFTMEGSGLLAHVFQHETDHLEGVLFIDKAKNLREVFLIDDQK